MLIPQDLQERKSIYRTSARVGTFSGGAGVLDGWGMKPKRSVCVQFSPADQEQMVDFLRKGERPVRVMKRALSLEPLNRERSSEKHGDY